MIFAYINKMKLTHTFEQSNLEYDLELMPNFDP